MIPSAWRVDYERRASKDLGRLDPPVRRRVLTAIERLTSDPSAGSLRRLAARPQSRLRVGDWRVILELDEANRTIRVGRVLPRGRAYDR